MCRGSRIGHARLVPKYGKCVDEFEGARIVLRVIIVVAEPVVAGEDGLAVHVFHEDLELIREE